MKAIVVRAFGSAALEEWPDPQPDTGEVIVAAEFIELNYPDLLVIDGRYQVMPSLPFVPGKSAVGRVAMCGEGVTSLTVGTRVAVQVEHGAYAEKIRVPASGCYLVPDGLDAQTAVALALPYQTAWFALRDRAGFAKGETVLALGAAGGVGLATVQLAKALGARAVIGLTRGPEKAARVRAAGADHVVETSRADLRDALRNEVRAATGGHGADIVVDPIGGAATDAALRALAWRGRLVVVGFAGGEIPTIRANYLLVKNIAVSGLQWSDYRDRTPELVARAQAEIFDLGMRGALKPEIDAVLPLREAMKGLRRIREDKAAGRILLKV